MTVEQRLARLENENRIVKGLLVIVCLAAGGLMSMAASAAQQSPASAVRARRFEVVGPNNTLLATLGSDGNSASLTLNVPAESTSTSNPDTGNIKAAHTEMQLTSSGISFFSVTGQSVVSLQRINAGDASYGRLVTWNSAGRQLAAVSAVEEGAGVTGGMITVYRGPDVVTYLGAKKNEAGGNIITYNGGLVSSAIGVDKGGNGRIDVRTATGVPVVTLSSVETGGVLMLFNNAGERLIGMMPGTDGNGFLATVDRAGKIDKSWPGFSLLRH